MREKEEREGVGIFPSHHAGGVRLTEFNSERGSNFVNRLNREATSDFFTNFLEEMMVVDLWKVFSKFGRVWEVYVPNKVDKWGRRFGFAKFLEVQDVEKLSGRLDEVWCGTFKLRVNLSKFGRKNNNFKQSALPAAKPTAHASAGRVGEMGKEGDETSRKSFREILSGAPKISSKDSKGKGMVEMRYVEKKKTTSGSPLPLVFEPDTDFLMMLEGSFVGRLVKGRNLKDLQLNLCLEGHRNIRVASLGDGRVLIFCQTGEDVGLVIGRKDWWEGILEDIRPWNPMMVASTSDS
jgi:hypothetical protein